MTSIKLMKKLFCGVSVLGILAVMLVYQYNSSKMELEAVTMMLSRLRSSLKKNKFLVETPTCRIPNLDPFDKSIAKLIHLHGPIVCEGAPSVTFEDGNVLRINWTAVNEHYDGDLNYCKYQPIVRKTDFAFSFGKDRIFSTDVEVYQDFIKVYCFDQANRTFYTNFHSLIAPNQSLEMMCDENFKQHITMNEPDETLNVLMIGIDSMSRSNYVRQMPLTRKYLLSDLDAIEMLGYTKVADNTFVNVVPMTSGKFVSELPWSAQAKTTFDKYNFIWYEYSKRGYRTLFAEDVAGMGMFTWIKPGFATPPAHHYNRIFSLSMAKDASLWSDKHRCVGDRLETDIVLKYVHDFAVLNRNKPHFGFAFLKKLSHDNINDAGAADEPHFRFLQELNTEGLLNNTVLIYFSDHGSRFGYIRETHVGMMEERLPMMSLVFPKWFKNKYPELIQNVEINSGRLTSPFDVYETLYDILYFKGKPKTANATDRRIGLFNEVPLNRTCEQAAISAHWCVCYNLEYLPPSSSKAGTLARFVMNYINEQLAQAEGKCKVLKVSRIHQFILKDTNEVDHGAVRGSGDMRAKIYQITFNVHPGDALFEASASFDEAQETYSLVGDVSRINKYGNKSACVDILNLKKFCFCRKMPKA